MLSCLAPKIYILSISLSLLKIDYLTPFFSEQKAFKSEQKDSISTENDW